MTEGEIFDVAAEVAYGATIALARAQGRRRGLPWDQIEPPERGRWRLWAEHVVRGTVEVFAEEEVPAAAARSVARAEGFTVGALAGGIGTIVAATARHFGLQPEALTGRSRRADTSDARHLAMYLAHLAGYSYPTIGRALGRRDHTTAMAAVRKMEARAPTVYAGAFRALLEEFGIEPPTRGGAAPPPPASGPALEEVLRAG